jgi:hypothetical protein
MAFEGSVSPAEKTSSVSPEVSQWGKGDQGTIGHSTEKTFETMITPNKGLSGETFELPGQENGPKYSKEALVEQYANLSQQAASATPEQRTDLEAKMGQIKFVAETQAKIDDFDAKASALFGQQKPS